MRAILSPYAPTQAAVDAGRRPLIPELGAAVAARRSRTPDTLEEILAKVDMRGQDQAVDSVFKFIDYGHASIADMVPLSIHLEGVSLWLIQYIWSLVQTGGGQESSTRYIDYSTSKFVLGPNLGTHTDTWDDYHSIVEDGLEAYGSAMRAWRSISEKRPELVQVPAGSSEAVEKRFRNNFVSDRARYWLPMACLNSANITTWAREWAEICRYLLSSNWLEARQLGLHIQQEIELGAPRMVKHCRSSDAYTGVLLDEHRYARNRAITFEDDIKAHWPASGIAAKCSAYLQVMFPLHRKGKKASMPPQEMWKHDMRHHKNRYDPIGRGIKKVAVEYGWTAVAIAEIRDMNRHRPGEKEFEGVPMGFYWAEDQIPEDIKGIEHEVEILRRNVTVGQRAVEACYDQLLQDNHSYIYWTNLGTQFGFSHTSTMNKLVYEMELRTGKGTHFRYRKHYQDLISELGNQYPELRAVLLEGSGEPE